MAAPQTRTYDPAECAVFRRTREKWGQLSNFAPAQIEVNGLRTYHAEGLYQACRFPHRPDIQQQVARQRNPMSAKKTAHASIDLTRADWQRVNIELMRWTLRVRLLQNPTLADVLAETEDRPIVEYSVRDHFWGAGYKGSRLVGVNALGRLLMELRQHASENPEAALSEVAPPRVSSPFINGVGIKTVTPPPEPTDHAITSEAGRIVNVYRTGEYDIKIGRDTRYGNPFPINEERSRARAISEFETWLRDQIRAGQFTLGLVASFYGKTLGCYCAPQPCHGQVWHYYSAWANALTHQQIRNGPTLPDRMTPESVAA